MSSVTAIQTDALLLQICTVWLLVTAATEQTSIWGKHCYLTKANLKPLVYSFGFLVVVLVVLLGIVICLRLSYNVSDRNTLING